MKKVSFKKKWLAMLMSIGFLGMTGTGFAMSEVQAAQPPVISELKVAESGDNTGIVAQCSYENYSDQSGYELTLYLFKKEESGRSSIVMREKLPYAVSGSGETATYQAEEGIYFASVGMIYGNEATQIYSESYYRVKIVDGKPEVSEVMEETEDETGNTDTETADNDAGDRVNSSQGNSRSDSEKSKGKACSHILEYNTERPATADQDSLLAYRCTLCGAAINYVEVPNSAYSTFLKETAEKIEKAGSNETVVVETERWMSFDKKVLNALTNRRDVTVKLYYRYQGKRFGIEIPAGADVSGLVDENGYCGFLYMAYIFGTVTEKIML